MTFGINSLNEIANMILEQKLKYADTVIIGDNSSGKSLLLKILIEKFDTKDEIYFIDAVNRGFDASKVFKEERKHDYKQSIIDTRMKPDYFNLRDSFSFLGTSTERVEQLYFLYEDKLQSMFERFTGDKYKVLPGDVLGEVEFGDTRGLLSSGYQAITRILLELLYYEDKCIECKNISEATVIIDELDEFLSPSYAFMIMPFLKKNFPKMNFVVTTHSCDLVAGTQNGNLIALSNSEYEVMDINDFQSVSEVQIVFDRIFGEHSVGACDIENELRRLLNNRINNAWSESDQMKLESIQKDCLSASQRIICRQISEW